MLRAPWRLGGDDCARRRTTPSGLRCSIRKTLVLSVVCDGELRRRHYIWGFLDGLTNTDTERLTKKRARAAATRS
jgi:hypothetical protein